MALTQWRIAHRLYWAIYSPTCPTQERTDTRTSPLPLSVHRLRRSRHLRVRHMLTLALPALGPMRNKIVWDALAGRPDPQGAIDTLALAQPVLV